LGVNGGRHVRLTTLPPSMSLLCRKYRILEVSQLYKHPRPVTSRAFLTNFTILDLYSRLVNITDR
jgi:hypothetical protein